MAALALGTALSAWGQSLPEIRMTPQEIRATASAHDGNQIGTSGLPVVHTDVLLGEPAKAGLYAILLFVPANTTIQANSHRDDRIATVVSGEWRFGYGDHFDPARLKTLSPGRVYSETGGVQHNHFARADADPVIVQISGYGPTDTRYFEALDDRATVERSAIAGRRNL